MEESNGQVNRSRGQVAASTVLNTCEMSSMGDSGGTGARSDAGGASCDRAGPDGHANRSGVSSGHVDMPDIRNGTNMTADAMESISTRRNTPQMQNLPIDAGRHDQAKPRSHAGMPNMWVDTHGIAIYVNMAGDMQRRVSTRTEGMQPPDSPTGCTRPCQDETNGLESCPGTQIACVHVQDVSDKSNTSANVSVKLDLPANGAEPCIGEPKWPRDPTDASDACTCMQSDADDSRRPTGNLEHIRRSQNGCKKSSSPAKPLKSHPEEPRKPRNGADALSGCTHVQSGRIDMKMTAKTAEVISTAPNKLKTPNSPIGAESWCRDKMGGLGNVADASTTRRGMQSD